MSVALVIEPANRIRRVVLSSVASPCLLHFSSLSHKRHDFEHNMCVLIFCTLLSKTFFYFKKNSARYRKSTYVFMSNTRYSCQILIELECTRQIFEKPSYVKFNQNPSSGSRVVPCRQTDGQIDRQTDITELIVGFRNYGNVPSNLPFS